MLASKNPALVCGFFSALSIASLVIEDQDRLHQEIFPVASPHSPQDMLVYAHRPTGSLIRAHYPNFSET